MLDIFVSCHFSITANAGSFSWDTSLPLWKFLPFQFSLIPLTPVAVLSQSWRCLLIMNEVHYALFPQRKLKHLKGPRILSHVSFTDYFTHITVLCRRAQILIDVTKKKCLKIYHNNILYFPLPHPYLAWWKQIESVFKYFYFTWKTILNNYQIKRNIYTLNENAHFKKQTKKKWTCWPFWNLKSHFKILSSSKLMNQNEPK